MIRRTVAVLLVFALVFLLAVPASANAPAELEYEHRETDYSSPIVILLLVIVTVGGIVGTCFLEWLVAFFYNLERSYGRLILLTNLVSQLLMQAVCFLLGLMGLYDSVIAVIVVEVCVYLLEFLFYRRKMQDVSPQRCLAYTLTANTASLIFGLFLNGIL